MKFTYQVFPVSPTSEFPDGKLYQPRIPIVLVGPQGERRFNALVDSGSDQTILPAYDVEELTGVTIDRRSRSTVKGRLEEHREELFLGKHCELLLPGDSESFQWPVVVWFSDDDSSPPILGHSGFLEYFKATFDGLKKELNLAPNKNFPGKMKKMKW